MTVRTGKIALLTIQAILLIGLNWTASCNRTEHGHIGAAVYFWHTGRFDIFCVNPPLTRIISGVPILLANPNYDWKTYSPRRRQRAEFSLGSAFLDANEPGKIRAVLLLARTALIPLILLGSVYGWRFASGLYGAAGGFVFLILWVFSPLMLGWGATLCPDTASAALGLVGLYTFCRWLRRPDWPRTLTAGVCLGLMPLTKTTWVIAFPLYFALWAFWRLTGPGNQTKNTTEDNAENQAAGGADRARRPSRPGFLRLMVILAVGLYILNMGYMFDGSFRPVKKYQFLSRALSGIQTEEDNQTGNRFKDSWLGNIPVPLPADFVLGIDIQKSDFERGRSSYLNGVTAPRGWKSYYLWVVLFKEPIGTLLLFLLAAAAVFRHPLRREELLVLFTGLTLFIFVSAQDGLSMHPRYILPAMGFFYLFAARTGRLLTGANRPAKATAAIGLAAVVLASLMWYPHSISYFNTLAGGAAGGPRHLLDSSADWGQAKYLLCDYCRRHPEESILTNAIGPAEAKKFSPANLRRVELLGDRPDDGKELSPGLYALSVNDVFGDDRYTPLRGMKPIHRVGAAIWIYRIERPLRLTAEKQREEKTP